jgi:hypothetical protein
MNHPSLERNRARRNGGGQVGALAAYRPLPGPSEAEADLAAAASPWLNDYLAFAGKWSPRSCPGFHEACAVWLLAAIAARRVRFHFEQPRYTSLYLALVGVSTFTAKSTVAQVALTVLQQADFDWLRLKGKATPQAFISLMVGQTPKNFEQMDEAEQDQAKQRFGFAAQRGWFYDEFGRTLAKMTRPEGYMSDFDELLRELDNCPPELGNYTQSRGDEKAKRPYLALLANLTPHDLQAVAGRGQSVWGTGFLARFAFVTPPLNEYSEARFPVGEQIVPADLIDPLRAWHRRLGLPTVTALNDKNGGFPSGPTRLKLTAPPLPTIYPLDEILDLIYEYRSALRGLLRDLNPDFHPFYGRFPERAIRIAALLASIEGDEAIRLKHWARGQAVTEAWRASLHRCYEQINAQTMSPEAWLEQRILKIVKQGGPQTASAIARSIKNYSSPQVKRVADGMVETGVLRLVAATGRQLKARYDLPLADQGDAS